MPKTATTSRTRGMRKHPAEATPAAPASPPAAKRSSLVRGLKWIAVVNGGIATLKTAWDNLSQLGQQAPGAVEMLQSILFYSGSLSAYVLTAFLPVGLIASMLIDGSSLSDRIKAPILIAIIGGSLGWAGYKTLFDPTMPLVPLYTQILGAATLGVIGLAIYTQATSKSASG